MPLGSGIAKHRNGGGRARRNGCVLKPSGRRRRRSPNPGQSLRANNLQRKPIQARGVVVDDFSCACRRNESVPWRFHLATIFRRHQGGHDLREHRFVDSDYGAPIPAGHRMTRLEGLRRLKEKHGSGCRGHLLVTQYLAENPLARKRESVRGGRTLRDIVRSRTVPVENGNPTTGVKTIKSSQPKLLASRLLDN